MSPTATAAVVDLEPTQRTDAPLLPTLHSRVWPISDPGDVVAFLAGASAALGGGALWAQAESGMAFAGAGTAEELTFEGDDRFVHASQAIRGLRDRVVRQDDIEFPLLAGFSFDPRSEKDEAWRSFPDGRLIVPQVTLQVTQAGAFLRVTLPTLAGEPESVTERKFEALADHALGWIATPAAICVPARAKSAISAEDRAAWEREVSRAIAAIRDGHMSKVVLARAETLQADNAISAVAALACLREEHAGATLFAFAGNDAWFIGATPERLVRLRDGRVDVTCLAGSAEVGRTPGETVEFGRQLLASKKDLDEHEIVVESTIDALRRVTTEVEREAGTPRLRKARSVQHLETPLSATARADADVLQLAGLLHPTPAVGGFPTLPAMRLIRQLEPFDRGWYAGPVGWVDLDGSGEFSVAIRSALLAGKTAVAYAGCGIVENSDPSAEYVETEMKLRPMLAALGDA